MVSFLYFIIRYGGRTEEKYLTKLPSERGITEESN
jgi:hypothetical protein